jgi:hypothetical protein
MNKQSPILFIILGLLIFTCLTSCDTFAPLESCGIETTANHDIFQQYFAEIQLKNLAANESEGSEAQASRIFEGANDLVIETRIIENTAVRLCIFKSSGSGKIMYDETIYMATGTSTIAIGAYDPGPYVVRVYADDNLVENIQFMVR